MALSRPPTSVVPVRRTLARAAARSLSAPGGQRFLEEAQGAEKRMLPGSRHSSLWSFLPPGKRSTPMDGDESGKMKNGSEARSAASGVVGHEDRTVRRFAKRASLPLPVSRMSFFL